ncbi:hypothetical protein J6590_058752 [Homalodisca vitripennis]|nr:hypothetical protein J6590_058752 [Homalodisca vitripennis]
MLIRREDNQSKIRSEITRHPIVTAWPSDIANRPQNTVTLELAVYLHFIPSLQRLLTSPCQSPSLHHVEVITLYGIPGYLSRLEIDLR